MFNIDFNSTNPVYLEIAESIIKMILNGTYQKNDKLPSIRSLSHALSINHNTVQRAYLELEHRGFIYSQTGKGMFICDNIDELNKKEHRKFIIGFEQEVKELIKLGLSKEEIIDIVNRVDIDE